MAGRREGDDGVGIAKKIDCRDKETRQLGEDNFRPCQAGIEVPSGGA